MKPIIITVVGMAVTAGIDFAPTKHIDEHRDVARRAQIQKLDPLTFKEKNPLTKVPVSVEDIAFDIATKKGWSGNEWAALKKLWGNESGWNTNALNPSSGACGIPQAWPCEKIGANWRDPRTQLTWGADYIQRTYGTPSAALYFWQNIAPSKPPYNGHWY
jgi:hypothetical protein